MGLAFFDLAWRSGGDLALLGHGLGFSHQHLENSAYFGIFGFWFGIGECQVFEGLAFLS